MEIRIPVEELRPLIESVVAEVLRKTNATARIESPKIALREHEAAELLGMHPKQLSAERQLGRLKFFRVGKSGVRYRLKELERYAEERERAEHEGPAGREGSDPPRRR